MPDIRYLYMLFLGIFLAVFTLYDLNSVISGKPLLGGRTRDLIHDIGGAPGIIASDAIIIFIFVRYVVRSLRNDKKETDSHT